MIEANYTTLYVGTDRAIAEKALSGNEACAIIYCESGYGAVYSENERAELAANNAIAMRRHGKFCEITLSSDFSGRFFICRGALADMLLYHYTEERNVYISKFNERSERKLLLLGAFTEGADVYALHTLLRLLRSADEEPTVRAGSASVKAIKEYIDSHTNKKLTLELLSKQFFISKTQIHRLFIAQYGISPMKYMLKAKIERAKEMLTSTDMKISEIAERLSFTDSKHFTKTFRNFMGILPSEYRNTR